jgi:hypothetical protein
MSDIDLGQPTKGQRAFVVQRIAHFAQVGAQFGIGVGQQSGQHTQGQRHRSRRRGKQAHVRSPP